MKYTLWIFQPEDTQELIGFDSDTPFLPIHKGDVLDWSLWIGTDGFKGFDSGDKLVVTGIKHIIVDIRGLSHQINVYTKLQKANSDWQGLQEPSFTGGGY